MTKVSALITGHTSGIGFDLSELLGTSGYQVHGISRRSSISPFISSQCIADLSTQEGIEKACEYASKKDVNQIIHCAGYNILEDVAESSYESWISMMNVHCFSIGQIFKTAYSVSPSSLEQVIIISSIWADQTCQKRAGYAMAKVASEKLCKHIAVECEETGIIAVAIRLGFVNTPLTSKSEADPLLAPFRKRMLLAQGTIAEPREVSGIIYDLIQKKHRYLTGSVLDLSAGISCQ